MSAMRDMSKAIRQELTSHGPSLREIPSEPLKEYERILAAYLGDLRDELQRRRREGTLQ